MLHENDTTHFPLQYHLAYGTVNDEPAQAKTLKAANKETPQAPAGRPGFSFGKKGRSTGLAAFCP
jgi:hypothetical protein